MMLAACSAIVMSCGTSGSKEEDGGTGDEPVAEVASLAEFSLSYSLSGTIREVVDAYIVVNVVPGNEITVAVSEGGWNGKYVVTELPASVECRLEVAMKDGVSLDKESYSVADSYKNVVSVKDSEGKVLSSNPSQNSGNMTFGADKVQSFIDKYDGKVLFSYSVDAEGNITVN